MHSGNVKFLYTVGLDDNGLLAFPGFLPTGYFFKTDEASSPFPFVSERFLFRSESRKLQVRKQWGNSISILTGRVVTCLRFFL